METKQPKWRYVANLGDVNPIDYGGLFVFEDETGVYDPEAEKLFTPEEGAEGYYEVFRFLLEPLKIVRDENRIYLVPKAYESDWPHTLDQYEPWFVTGGNLESLLATSGYTREEFEALITSESSTQLAIAYQAIGDHFGYHELDSYPLRLSEREIRARYRKLKL